MRDEEEREMQYDQDMSTKQYWDRVAAERAERPERPISKLEVLYKQAANTDASPKMLDQVAQAREQIAVLERAAKATENARWTREITIVRRQAWNEAIQDTQYHTRSGSVLTGKVEMALGYQMDALKRQIARHNL